MPGGGVEGVVEDFDEFERFEGVSRQGRRWRVLFSWTLVGREGVNEAIASLEFGCRN